MSEKRFEKGFTKIGHIHCIFEDVKETNMLFHDNDDTINPYCKDGKSNLDRVVDKLNELSDENEQLQEELKKAIQEGINQYNENGRLSEKLEEQQSTIDEIEKNFDDLVEWASKIANRNVVLDEKIGELQRENEQLRKELGDCEKFRYTVFQRLNEEYKKECSIR